VARAPSRSAAASIVMGLRASSGPSSPKACIPIRPNLKEVADDEPRQIFWVIKNGINMTGMPSFGKIGVDDKEIWSIVAFVKKWSDGDAGEFQGLERAVSVVVNCEARASAPKQSRTAYADRDCFASLAMTGNLTQSDRSGWSMLGGRRPGSRADRPANPRRPETRPCVSSVTRRLQSASGNR